MIRELQQRDRNEVFAFFVTLGESDRYRRFGRVMTDEAVASYVGQLDWGEGVLLGAYDAHARLVGLLELARLPNGSCEIAVVVDSAHRGRGLGKALMDRALLKAKVHGCERVVLLCQVDNQPMRRLACSAGLTSTTEDGEVSGSMELPHAAFADLTEDLTRDAMGNATYASLLTSRTLGELFQNALRATAHAARPHSA